MSECFKVADAKLDRTGAALPFRILAFCKTRILFDLFVVFTFYFYFSLSFINRKGNISRFRGETDKRKGVHLSILRFSLEFLSFFFSSIIKAKQIPKESSGSNSISPSLPKAGPLTQVFVPVQVPSRLVVHLVSKSIR